MAAKRRKKGPPKLSLKERNFREGVNRLDAHTLFWRLVSSWNVHWVEKNPPAGWAAVTYDGDIRVNGSRLASPEEWEYVLGHLYLHLGMGHFQRKPRWTEWNLACDCMVRARLLALGIGRAPEEFQSLPEGPNGILPKSEVSLYERLCEGGLGTWPVYRLSGGALPDMIVPPDDVNDESLEQWRKHHESQFAYGLRDAVREAVELAGGLSPRRPWEAGEGSEPRRAKEWCMSSYPLLGALAASFEIIEDARTCQRLQISVAAVSESDREIYFNPAAGLNREETRFVMAHELLHVALRHMGRQQGRDHYLWNVACDFAINSWLIEMKIGEAPQMGLLFDPVLKDLSAEEIYDRIVKDLRLMRRVCTLRGKGLGDMLGPADGCCNSTDLDDFYRRSLARGIDLHERQGRGMLPAGLSEEIRALLQPPVPWEVELARWFDAHFAPTEPRRTYARASRRQSAAPDIPLPRAVAQGPEGQRTFGVLLDTSGSMDRQLLARALGAIAGFAAAKEVTAARVVFCDAHAYDQGFMPAEQIAGRVTVRGRGGTVLQPGIDLLEQARDFPADGPLLIITDGYCDRFRVRREHAILLPPGVRLPFSPRGKVFEMSDRV
jgi:predicted metal-dependent peptidase